MKALKTILSTFIVLLLSHASFAEDFTSVEWMLGQTDRELLIVEVIAPQAEDGTNQNPPNVNMTVDQVGKERAGLPYEGRFNAGLEKPEWGTDLKAVVWDYDLDKGEHIRYNESYDAYTNFMAQPLKAPKVGSKWVILLRANDTGVYETHGKYRHPYSDEKYDEYLSVLQKVVRPAGVAEGDAEIIKGCNDEILIVTFMGGGRAMVQSAIRGQRTSGKTIRTNESLQSGIQWIVMGKMNDEGTFVLNERVRYTYEHNVGGWVQRQLP